MLPYSTYLAANSEAIEESHFDIDPAFEYRGQLLDDSFSA